MTDNKRTSAIHKKGSVNVLTNSAKEKNKKNLENMEEIKFVSHSKTGMK